ncbi:class I SAM-dependent methyltransferase [Halosegnis sp.]|uniref:class I SAM-dependent methyltransferase n=1 Tax=Halosegnis sp. TaxID=2864959 RepID=UPI0035D3F564
MPDNPPDLPDIASGYDALTDWTDTESLATPWATGVYQQTFTWPATTQLVPDPANDRVLLAGCGRGDTVEWFLERDAAVVGVDISAGALAVARERHPSATFHHGRLANASTLLEEPVDLVVSHLVVSHVPSLAAVFAALREAARLEATLVVTTIHPRYLAEQHDIDRYASPTATTSDWSTVDLPTYYRPTGRLLESVATTGWRLTAVREPEPPAQLREHAPERYERALERPELLVLQAQADDPVGQTG